MTANSDSHDAPKRAYTVTPDVVAQRSDASRTHGLFAAPSVSVSEPLKRTWQSPRGNNNTSWQLRRGRVRRRTEALLIEFPHLNAGRTYTRAVGMWWRLTRS